MASAQANRNTNGNAKRKRVLALAGGGPAAGLHVGVLERLQEKQQKFDIWSLSCIGAWVGIVWQQADPGSEAAQTKTFFRDGVFRNDRSYSRFPINTVFGPDLSGNVRALVQFLTDFESYRNLVLPEQIVEAARQTLHFLGNPRKWNAGDFNTWMLDSVLAVHPMSRFLTSMMYLSNINGLSRIYYPESTFLAAIKFKRLEDNGKPLIYHNAWNLSRQQLELFTNRSVPRRNYKRIDARTLCACSALPYIEGTVDIDGDTYCEGALVDTVSFRNLVEDHDDPNDHTGPKIDEVWVSRIVDTKQIRTPRNLTEALGNLCMLFAAETGKNDIKLFKHHLKEENREHVKVVEIPVSHEVSFDWSRSNFERGIEEGKEAVDAALQEYEDIDFVTDKAKEFGVELTDDEARDLLKPSSDRVRQYARLIERLVKEAKPKAKGAGAAKQSKLSINELLGKILPRGSRQNGGPVD